MKNSFKNILSILLPNKKINLFTIFVIFLGIISGSIFLIILNSNDKDLVITKITEFMSNIDANKLNNINALKNALIENGIFVVFMWILGFSMIGIIINIFITYLRGFIVGFSISSFILSFKYKGIISSLIYIFPTTLINLFVTILISVYSISFSIMLYKSIFNKSNNLIMKSYIKKYFYILLISLGLSAIASIFEAFLIPSLMKLVVKLFI